MDSFLALVAAALATAFTIDLFRDYRHKPRPHVAAYAAGMAMFAIASWALLVGLTQGWSGPVYRIFILFGAILNIPTLAAGSMFVVVGKKAGHAFTIFTGALAAISTTLVSTVAFAAPFPETGLAEKIFPAGGFGPRTLIAIGSGVGATVLMVLALVSIFRFRRRSPRLVAGNLLIMAGTLAGAIGGAQVSFLGATTVFELSLMVTVALIWLGYRVSRGARTDVPKPIRIVLVGPSTLAGGREQSIEILEGLESVGFSVMCPARDVEDWGAVGFSPAETLHQVFGAVESADLVLVDLSIGYCVEVVAGYARALRIPVIVAAPEGTRISRPLRGIAGEEIYYSTPDDVIVRMQRFLGPSET